MNVRVPRPLIILVGALFSSYLLVLALYAAPFGYSDPVETVYVGMAVFAVAMAAVLIPSRKPRMPIWLGAFSMAIAIVLPIIVATGLDPHREGGNGYSTWYLSLIHI